MSTVASYYLYQKYEKRGNQPWLPSYPNVWSIDGDGTMPVVKKMDADPDCPIYRWTPTEDTICIEGQYRTTTSDTFYCGGESGYDKYVDVYTEYSEDGIHWTTIETAATLVEEESEDCGFVPYQKRYLTFIPLDDTTFTCSVPSELTANTFEYSVDSGQTWTQWRVTTPTTTIRAGQKMYIRGGGGHDSYVYGIMGTIQSDGRFNVEGNIMSVIDGVNFSGITDFDFYGIGNGAFQSMFSGSRVVNAENLILPATDLAKRTQFVSDGGFRCYMSMFEGCTELVKAPKELPALILNYQCYAGMFANCTSLTSIPNELPATAITEGSYGSMFKGCTAITESPIIRVERFTSQSYDYYSCSEMFSGCTSLTGITSYIEEPKWNETYNWVKDVAPQGVFRQPSSATTKWGVGDSGIPNGWVVEDIDTHTQYRWTESGTTCIGYDKYKNNIKEQSIDSGQTWTVVIPEVYSASTLIEANSPDCGYVPPSPKFVLTLNNATTVSGICGSNAISSGETKAYKTSTVSAVIYDCVSAISGKTFENFTNLTSVTIPNTVTIIGSYAFRYCYALASLTIPSSVKKINDEVFNNCSGITSLTIDTGLEDIGASAFANCSGLTSVTLPSSVTKIAGSAFRYCTNLQSITCLAETPPFLAGYYSFYDTNNCPIYVPCESVDVYKAAQGWSDYSSRIEGIPPCGQPTPTGGKFTLTLSDSSTVTAECDSTSAVTSGEVATQYSGSVVSAVIGDCVTSIGRNAFRQCASLTSVTIPNSVTNIDRNAFYICTGLTSISVLHSVTTIGNYAFSYCSSLTSCTIGSGVTSIGDAAFSGCTSLTSVTCYATTPPTLVNQTTYNRTFENTNDCPIYVPSESVNAYKAATNWSTYASRIQAIPNS